MSTRASVTTPPIVISDPPSVRTPSYESGAFHTPRTVSPLDADFSSPTYFMAEDARGDIPPSTHDSVTQDGSEAHDAPDTTTSTALSPERNEEHEATTTTAPPEEDSGLLPPLTDRDDSSLLPLSSENGDQERGNNQTLIEEHEMRRKLMDVESSFLPEPSTIDVAATGPTAGADDTYLVGVGSGHDADTTQQTESSQLSLMPPSETHPDFEQSQVISTEGREDGDATPAVHAEQPANDLTLDSFTSPSAAAAARSALRTHSNLSEDTPNTSQFSQDERPFRSQFSQSEESQLTPSKLRKPSRSLSPGPSRLFSDQSGSSIGGSRRSGNRPKYLMSRQSANRLSHSSVTSNNTETTNSDATLAADYALQSGGAVSDHWGGLNAGSRSHMTRTTSLGSMASGISGYSEENSLERRAPADGGLQTLEEESSPRSTRQTAGAEDIPAPETPKAKPHDSAFPTDTVIAERAKGVHVPTVYAQKYREDYGNLGPSPEKQRPGAATPAFGRSGRTMTLKEQSSTIDRLSKENFDLKMRIHFLNEALNKRSEEGIKEMISENVELKSDKLKLQKDNQTLKRKMRDLEKQLKDQQSDKESMVNHDPEASEDENRESDADNVYLRERLETYEVEISRLRSESLARESEKRRLAEMVKSLSEARAGGSDVGAREERVRSLILNSCPVNFKLRLFPCRTCGKICWRPKQQVVSKRKRRIVDSAKTCVNCGMSHWVAVLQEVHNAIKVALLSHIHRSPTKMVPVGLWWAPLITT